MSRLQAAIVRARASRFPVRLPTPPSPSPLLVPVAIAPAPAPTPSEQLVAILQAAPQPFLASQQFRRIHDVVAAHYGFARNDIISIRRTGGLIRARHTAMYLARLETSKSLPEIGRLFGGRDHTTVLHAVNKMAKRAADDPEYAAEIETLRGMLHDR